MQISFLIFDAHRQSVAPTLPLFSSVGVSVWVRVSFVKDSCGWIMLLYIFDLGNPTHKETTDKTVTTDVSATGDCCQY